MPLHIVWVKRSLDQVGRCFCNFLPQMQICLQGSDNLQQLLSLGLRIDGVCIDDVCAILHCTSNACFTTLHHPML